MFRVLKALTERFYFWYDGPSSEDVGHIGVTRSLVKVKVKSRQQKVVARRFVLQIN